MHGRLVQSQEHIETSDSEDRRPSGHSYEVPKCRLQLIKTPCIIRCLYSAFVFLYFVFLFCVIHNLRMYVCYMFLNTRLKINNNNNNNKPPQPYIPDVN